MAAAFGRREVRICPRCGDIISWIERRTVNGQTYYYAVHYMGRDGSGKKKVRKCYLGPNIYRYVSLTHEFSLRGLVDKKRIIRYLQEIAAALARTELEPEEKEKIKQILKTIEQKIS